MCGRFTLTVDPADLQMMLELGEVPLELQPRYNIAPTQPVAVVASAENRKVEIFQWGLIPSWSKDPSMAGRMINARAETLHEKPAYRVPFARKRCLILADGFFEWKEQGKGKQPYFIQLQSREPFAFAGLWDHWISPEGDERRTCSIITCDPNNLMAEIHNRMPVILSDDRARKWIEPGPITAEALTEFTEPFPATDMVAHPVSTLVNNPRNDSPAVLGEG